MLNIKEISKFYIIPAALLLPIAFLNGNAQIADFRYLSTIVMLIVFCATFNWKNLINGLRIFPEVLAVFVIGLIFSVNDSDAMFIGINTVIAIVTLFSVGYSDRLIAIQKGMVLYVAVYTVVVLCRNFLQIDLTYRVDALYQVEPSALISRSSGLARMLAVVLLYLIFMQNNRFRKILLWCATPVFVLLGSKVNTVCLALSIFFSKVGFKAGFWKYIAMATATLVAFSFIVLMRTGHSTDPNELLTFNGRLFHWFEGLKHVSIMGHGYQYDRKLINDAFDNAYIYLLVSGGLLIAIPLCTILLTAIRLVVINSNFNSAIIAFFLARSFFENSIAVYSIDQLFFLVSYILLKGDKKSAMANSGIPINKTT